MNISVSLKDYYCEYKCRIEEFRKEIENDKTVDERKYKNFYKLNRNILEKADSEWQTIKDKKEKRKYSELIRDLLSEYFFKSKLFKYSYDKPRGYPGDFLMMDYIYNYKLESENILGKYFDKFYLDNPYAEAVRCRKNKMVEVTGKLYSMYDRCRVLNIACGPSREVKEIFKGKPKINNKIEMLLIDHDDAALEFSKKELAGILTKIDIKFIKEDVFKFFKKPEEGKRLLGKFDVVYSTGLADYLPDLLLSKMIFFGYEVLKKDGFFILAHKIEDQDSFAPVTPRFICDWYFHKRSEKDLDALINKSAKKGYKIDDEIWDESGRIKFIIIKKM